MILYFSRQNYSRPSCADGRHDISIRTKYNKPRVFLSRVLAKKQNKTLHVSFCRRAPDKRTDVDSVGATIVPVIIMWVEMVARTVGRRHDGHVPETTPGFSKP